MNITDVHRPIAQGQVAVLDIAGTKIRLESDIPLEKIEFDSAYAKFIGDGEPDLTLRCDYTDAPLELPDDAETIFDSQCLWTLAATKEHYYFVLEAPDDGLGPYRIARFDRDFSRGVITSLKEGRVREHRPLLPDPLEYPLGEAISVSLMGLERGLMVHACGLADKGRGYLLVGHSGYGKSTIAGILEDQMTLLNDDRIILKIVDGETRMFGTPWHGDHPGVDPMGVPVAGIFLIAHGEENVATPIGPMAATANLISRSFPPLWSKEGMDFTLDFAQTVVTSVPCFTLAFAPDSRVIDTIRCAV